MITRWHGNIRTTLRKSMEKPEIRFPAIRNLKTPEPMATKTDRREYVPDIYPSSNLHYDPIKSFAPTCEVAYQMFTRLVFIVFGVLPTRYRLGRCADFDDQYVKRRKDMPFKGPRTNFYILTLFSPKTHTFGRFSTGLRKFRLKTGFILTWETSSVNTH